MHNDSVKSLLSRNYELFSFPKHMWYMDDSESQNMKLYSPSLQREDLRHYWLVENRTTRLNVSLLPANERRRYWLIVGLLPANKRRRYKVTPSLTG